MAIIKRPFRIKKADGSWEEHRFPTSEDMIVDAVQNLSGTGYRKLPGGLILQWGTYGTSVGGQYLRGMFPITFPTEVLAMFTTIQYTGDESVFHLATPQIMNTSDYIIYIRNTLSNNLPNQKSKIAYFAIGR